jgi:uncharacterized protein
MARRTGNADLPLHSGRVPAWLAVRMAALGRVMTEAIIHHFGRDEFLRRLSNPFWFQSFGAVMVIDWHSSGITTSLMGSLKRGLDPIKDELGIYVCGGRGRHSRQTPAELLRVGDRVGVDATALVRASRLVAKIDSAAVQDGFELYLHAFVTTPDGKWCVVQQGMSDARGEARRYHWLSEGLQGFFDSPHAAIDGRNVGSIINLADARADRARRAGLDLVHDGPDRTVAVLRHLRTPGNAALELFPESLPQVDSQPALPHLRMPAHHDVRASDVMLKRLHGTLAAAAERGPEDFSELLLTPGIGTRTVASLAMVAEVLYGAPSRFTDPARFSLAHGGKDGHPFPVPLEVYDRTLRVLTSAVSQAKLGRSEKLAALQRLDRQARLLERSAAGPNFASFIGSERAESPARGGRSVSRC